MEQPLWSNKQNVRRIHLNFPKAAASLLNEKKPGAVMLGINAEQ
jgi:hypothetical protein